VKEAIMQAQAPRRIVVFGVASEDSIAWHVAQGLKAKGAAVHLGYQQRFRSRVLQLVKGANHAPDGVYRCDLTSDVELDELVRSVGGPIDGLVHSVAFAPPSTFNKRIEDIDGEEFSQALLASTHSLLRLARATREVLAPEASLVTMTYIGAQRVVPGYRLMGIAKAALEAAVRELAVELGPRGVRVNAISAGPIRTLSARAVPRFDEMRERYRGMVPLRRCVEGSDVADVAEFLLSPAARCITGQVIYVDAGFSILSVPDGA
jgi:enoyl-[acyl-carrier protein] reductase I